MPKPTPDQRITIKIPKPLPRSTESWWIDRGRDGFTREAQRRMGTMSAQAVPERKRVEHE